MKLMTLLSDFGSNSSYVAQMKGVALSMTDATILDINHDIAPHDIFEGAFVLRTSIPYFPIGTVNVAVVDPEVGTARRGIVIATKTQIFVGPDNGILIPAARCLGDFTIFEISNRKLMLSSVSDTFHGRDVFTPVAAHILNGILFEQVGPIVTDFVDLDFGKYEVTGKTAIGKIIHIDSFGNIITNIDGLRLKQVLSYDKKITLVLGKKKLDVPFVRSYNFVKKGQILATIGSSNLLEIALNQGDASKKLDLEPFEDIKILFN